MAGVLDSYVGSGERAATFRTFLDAISDLALVAALDGRILFANEVLIRKLGHHEGDLARMGILDLVPTNDREATEVPAWFRINVITYNLLTALKRKALPERYRLARPKRLRFEVFTLPAKLAIHESRSPCRSLSPAV